jgi:RHS repeat-associated protein
VYVAVVLDGWSRRVVGWSIADHIRAELVVDALQLAHTATVTGTTNVTYVRDATGRIITRTENGTATGYGFAGPGDSPAFTTGLLGLVVDRFVPLPGGVSLKKGGSGDVWSYPNIHGDVVATANAAGAKQGPTLSYDPFGQGTAPDNATGNLDYGWQGQNQRGTEHAPGVNTIEMGARQYLPGAGRFLQVDPVEGGSCNDYDYSCADPVNKLDTTGTFHYTFRFDLGETDQTPDAVFAHWAGNFAELFPLQGAPDRLRKGADISLSAFGIPFPVHVSDLGRHYFKFTTLWYHPDFDGWISFFLYMQDGHMFLRVHGYVPDWSAGGLLGKRAYRGIAHHMWGPLADNLREHLGN